MFHYLSYLFDSRSAWESAVADYRFRYDMQFSAFMAIYAEYRKGNIEAQKPKMHVEQPFKLPTLEAKIT